MPDIDFLSVLLIAVGLSADCFAVAISASIVSRNLPFGQIWRGAFFFGAFQGLMPVLGWLAGRTVVDFISAYDHWLALALLAFIGGRMIWESWRRKGERSQAVDVTRWLSLLVLSVATSIDALAVGLSLAFLETDIVTASVTIGIVAFIVSAIGFAIGKKVGSYMGKRAGTVGGLILIGIGIRIVLEHIL